MGKVWGIVLLLLFCWGVFTADPASADVKIKIKNLTYEPCQGEGGKNLVLGGGTMPATCYMIKGTAVNPSNKTIYNADVFGRVYDANGNDVLPERGRLGSVDVIPPGESEFQIMLSVPRDQPPPLKLEKFKAVGFTGTVRR
ncbi:MAG: FxLYD domain-containing protein [Pseudanabaenaceae cyanobacterium]